MVISTESQIAVCIDPHRSLGTAVKRERKRQLLCEVIIITQLSYRRTTPKLTMCPHLVGAAVISRAPIHMLPLAISRS